jgi:hypothetical protein
MSTLEFIILIGCTTLVALVAIICDHLYEKKIASTTEKELEKKIVKIHRNYIIGVLAFAIIMLITAKYGYPNSARFDYLSFASTITSLVLSILAIFVTVKSSTDLYKQFSRMDDTTYVISSASEKIEGSLDELTKAKDSLHEASSDLSNQLDNIVEKIDERIKIRMQETESHISSRLEESMNKINVDVTQNTHLSGEAMETYKKNYVLLSSAYGLLSIYASSLSLENNKSFKINEIFKNNEIYVMGYLISAVAAGIVSFNNYINSDNNITCTSSIYNSTELSDNIRKFVAQFGVDYKDVANVINRYFGLADWE